MDFRIVFLVVSVCAAGSVAFVLPIPTHLCETHCTNCTEEEFDLQCGSDGVTYLNLCEFNCSREHCDSSLKLAHVGLCGDVHPKPEKDGNTVTAAVPSGKNATVLPFETVPCDPFDDCDCTYDLLLCCGTDGQTYPNECAMHCARKCNKDLLLLHFGACYT